MSVMIYGHLVRFNIVGPRQRHQQFHCRLVSMLQRALEPRINSYSKTAQICVSRHCLSAPLAIALIFRVNLLAQSFVLPDI